MNTQEVIIWINDEYHLGVREHIRLIRNLLNKIWRNEHKDKVRRYNKTYNKKTSLKTLPVSNGINKKYSTPIAHGDKKSSYIITPDRDNQDIGDVFKW